MEWRAEKDVWQDPATYGELSKKRDGSYVIRITFRFYTFKYVMPMFLEITNN